MAKLTVALAIQALPETIALQPAQFIQWAQAAYQQQQAAVVNIKIVSLAESQQLNLAYRQQDKPTNVLSFPMGFTTPEGEFWLGDIALCTDIIQQEITNLNRSQEAYWAHMLVHGMLHLQGYDHKTEPTAQAMETLEAEILQTFGYDNPYS